jgi:putative acetyltransferase
MRAAIRGESSGDEAALRALHKAAFPSDTEARLVDAIRANGNDRVSLVAVADGKVVGHVLFSPVEVEGSAGLGLAPVAVLPAFQGRGIGAALIEAGIAACREQGVKFVVVLGEPGYYRRFGFRATHLGNEYGAGEAFMALELEPHALAAVHGVVKYGMEFSAFA